MHINIGHLQQFGYILAAAEEVNPLRDAQSLGLTLKLWAQFAVADQHEVGIRYVRHCAEQANVVFWRLQSCHIEQYTIVITYSHRRTRHRLGLLKLLKINSVLNDF